MGNIYSRVVRKYGSLNHSSPILFRSLQFLFSVTPIPSPFLPHASPNLRVQHWRFFSFPLLSWCRGSCQKARALVPAQIHKHQHHVTVSIYNHNKSTMSASRRWREGCSLGGGSPLARCPYCITPRFLHSSTRSIHLAVFLHFPSNGSRPKSDLSVSRH